MRARYQAEYNRLKDLGRQLVEKQIRECHNYPINNDQLDDFSHVTPRGNKDPSVIPYPRKSKTVPCFHM